MHTGSEKLGGKFSAVKEDRSGGILFGASIPPRVQGSIRLDWAGGASPGGKNTVQKESKRASQWLNAQRFLLKRPAVRAAGDCTRGLRRRQDTSYPSGQGMSSLLEESTAPEL
jgi:hypothetical protein